MAEPTLEQGFQPNVDMNITRIYPGFRSAPIGAGSIPASIPFSQAQEDATHDFQVTNCAALFEQTGGDYGANCTSICARGTRSASPWRRSRGLSPRAR